MKSLITLRLLFLSSFILLFSVNTKAADFYWVGGTGDWSDFANHWADSSGGNNFRSNAPTSFDRVIFDSLSFSAPGQTVTFDVGYAGVQDIFFQTQHNPTFLGAASDTISIFGSLTLAPSMTYSFGGKLFFSTSTTDSIALFGHSLLNDVNIASQGTYNLYDDFTTTGTLIHRRGFLNSNGNTITARAIDGFYGLIRNMNFANSTINLSGSNKVFYFRQSNLSSDFTGAILNLTYSGTDTVKVATTDAIQIEELNVTNSKLDFYDKNKVDSLFGANLDYIGFDFGRTYTYENIQLSTDCGKYIHLTGRGGLASLNNQGTSQTFDFVKLRDLNETGAANTATNSLDLGGLTNFTVTERPGTVDYFWIGGQANFYSSTSWALTSGGASSGCIPGPNDNVIFDVNSGIAALDTLFLNENIKVNSMKFLDIANSLVLSGPADSIIVQDSLIGSNLLVFDWNNLISINRTGSRTEIISNGLTWGCDINITVSDTVLFSDTLRSSQTISLISGTIDFNEDYHELYNFDVNPTNVINLNLDNTFLNITGENLDFSSANLTISHDDARIDFTHNTVKIVNFDGRDFDYDTINFMAQNFFLKGNDKTFDYWFINPGTTVIVNNGVNQNYNELVADGTCDKIITLKAFNQTTSSPIFTYTGGVQLLPPLPPIALSSSVEYCIIDNIDTDTTGFRVYNANTSNVINGSDFWTENTPPTPKTYYWINDGGNWSDTSHWSLSSGGVSTTCLPGVKDTVYFDSLSFTTTGQIVHQDIEAYVKVMDWSTAKFSPEYNMSQKITMRDDAIFNKNMDLTRNNRDVFIALQPDGVTADLVTDSVFFDVPIIIDGRDETDPVELYGPIFMNRDSVIFVVSSGGFNTRGNDISAAAFVMLSPNTKDVDLDTSYLDLAIGFDDNSGPLLTFDAGTSLIRVDSNQVGNYFKSVNGLTFNDVDLKFHDAQYGELTGSNTFNNLTIRKGSKVAVENGTVQTVTGLLDVTGDCRDSIYIKSDLAATEASFSSNAAAVDIYSTNLEDIHAAGTATFTAFFSTDFGNTTGWTFDASPSTTASFTTPTNLCFGDTTLFSNTSTAFDSNPSSLTFEWDFGDGETLSGDTTKHVFETTGDIDVQLISTYTNFCKDTTVQTISIKDPIVNLSSSVSDGTICSTDSVYFYASGTPNTQLYEFFINGVSQNTASNGFDTLVVATLQQGDTVNLVGVDTGCPAYSDSIIFTVNPLPIPTLYSTDTTICDQDTVILYAGGANEYRFFNNDVGILPFSFNDSIIIDDLVNNDVLYVIGRDTMTGCRDTTSIITFTVNSLPNTVLAESDGDLTICDGDQVTFTASGANDYQFFANNVAQTGFMTAVWDTTLISSGENISVLGRSAEGCLAIAPQNFTYVVNPIPNTVLTNNDADTSICDGTNVQFVATGASVFQFFINGTSQGPASGTPVFNSSTLADNDNVYVLGTTNNCVGVSDTFNFEVIANPSLVFTSSDANDTICSGETVSFNAAGGTTYQYFVNGTSQGPISATSTFTTSSLLNGQSVSVDAFQNGCESSDQFTYVVNPTPNVNFYTTDNDATICEGGNINFVASNATNYEFLVNGASQGAATTTNTFSSTTLPSGTVLVEAVGSSNLGCADTSSTLSITVNPIPTTSLASSDADDEICEYEAVTFTGTNAGTYQFFIDGVSQGLPSATATFTPSQINDGETISVKGFFGTCNFIAPETYTMTVNPKPTITFVSNDADNYFCEGAAVTLTAGGATSYEFIVNNVSQGAASGTTTFDASGLTPGVYNVSVVGFNATGCNDTLTQTLNVQAPPTISLTSSDADNIICSGDNVVFTANGASIYQFTVNGTLQGTAGPNNTFSGNTFVDGDVISVNATNIQGCNSITAPQITLNVLPTPVVSLTSSDLDGELCFGDVVTFTAGGATDYEFFVNGVSAQGPSTSAVYNTDSISDNEPIMVVGSTGACSSNGTSTFIYNVNNYPIVSLVNNSDTVLCTGELTDVEAFGGVNYLFYVNGTPQGAPSTTATFQNTLNNGDVLTVEGESNNCTTLANEAITYSVFTFPTTTVTSSDANNEICKDELVTFTASGAMEYEFFVDALSQGQGANNVFNTNQIIDGQTVSVTGYNADCGQPSTTSFTFVVHDMNLSVTANPADYILCEGEPLELTMTGGDEYEFFLNNISQGAQSANATFTYPTIVDGEFVSVNAFNSTTGCTQNLDNDIYPTVIAAPLVVANNATVFCEGDSTVLVANSSYGNQWYLDGNAIAGATDTSYVAYISGDYTFEFTAGGNGEIWSIGYNANGEFGSGNNFNSPIPTVAEMLTTANQLSSGNEFTGALLSDGTLWNWGQNSSGQLGQGTFTSSSVPVQVNGIPAITQFAFGAAHAHAVDAAGNVYAWGGNNFGQLGNGNTAVVNFPQMLASINGVASVSSGLNHTIYLRTDGTVWSSGSNNFGQLGDGTLTSASTPVQVPGLVDVVKVGTGENHSFAIDNNGNLYVWGANSYGQLGLGDITNRLNATLSGLDNVSNADGGANHSVFLTETGKVYSSGRNQYGQLGNGTQTDSWVPVQNVLNGVSNIAVGQYHSVAIKMDNSVWGYGRNQNNQLGDLAPIEILSPTIIPNVEGATEVEAGKSSTSFIYNNASTCVSNVIPVTANPTPQATIAVSGIDLTANAGASYIWYIDGIVIAGATTQVIDPQATGNYTVLVTYANGCSSLSDEFYHQHVGLEEFDLGSISLYPNPSTDILNIDLSHLTVNESIQLNVRDMAGRLILSKQLVSLQEKLEVSTWLKGVYVLEFQIGEFAIVKRIVRQ